MHWIMLSERSDEHELSIDGTPPMVEAHDWRFDLGEPGPGHLPIIDVPFDAEPDDVLVDNIPAYGCRGLLINHRVKAALDAFPVDNIQYYDARLINERTRRTLTPYWIANIVGRVACVDQAASRLEYYDDGQIRFIDSLVLRPPTDVRPEPIFRLAELPAVIVVSDALKEALSLRRVTGFRYYRPEEFFL